VAAAWRARAVPIDPGWPALAGAVPLMSTQRATVELGWRLARDAHQVLRELLDGLRDEAALPTPPPATGRLPSDATREPTLEPAPAGGMSVRVA
jgi:hypothetical protein